MGRFRIILVALRGLALQISALKKVLVVLWLLAVGVGVHALLVYKGKAGDAGRPPEHWPITAGVSLVPNKPLLVMFAHPMCPCTKASIGELEKLVAEAKDRFQAMIVFYEPDEVFREWSHTKSIAMARAIPGVQVMLDQEGKVTRRFKVETSGHTLLYSPEGRLLFSGGITGSRGHIGENAGGDAVLELVQGQHPPGTNIHVPVFGCGLFDSCSEPKLSQN
jgi:AhpC/TSA family